MARGRRRRSGGLEVSVAVLGTGAEPPRVAYAVSRAHGSAVARNSARRRLRSAVRANCELLEPGHGYLFRPLHPIKDRTQAELTVALGELLRGSRAAQ